MPLLYDLKIHQQHFAHPSSSLLAVRDALRGMPNENSTFTSNTHDVSLIRWNLDLYLKFVLIQIDFVIISYLRNAAWVSNTWVVADALIVVPNLKFLVLTAWNEMLAFFGDGESVDLSRLWAVEHADGLTIEAVPVGDFAVWASGQELRLVGVVNNLLEHGWFEEAHHASVALDVPNNAGAVKAGRDSLSVSLVDADVSNAATVLLERSLHNLGLLTDSPDADLTLHTSRDEALAVSGGCECGNSVVVGIINSVEELAWLGKESADLSIVPTTDNALSISHELDWEALKAWDLDSEELLAGLHVPNTDVVERAGCEKLWILIRECNSIDALIMASVTELRVDLVAIAPVDGSLWSSAEKVSGVSSKSNWSNGTHNLGLWFNEHILNSDLCNGSISSTDDQVSVGKNGNCVDALGEEALDWTESLEKSALKWDLNNITSLGSEIGVLVSGINYAASEHTLYLSHVDILELDLFVDEIGGPKADTIVVDGNQLRVRFIVELNRVSSVSANLVSAESLSSCNL